MWWPWQRKKRLAAPPLLMLNNLDAISLPDIYEGVFICGSTGSGKTSGPGEELARALLMQGAGFCVMCAKADEYARWQRLCEQTGRAADLVRFAPGSGVCCDLLNAELSHPQGTVEAAAQLLALLLEIESTQGEGRGDEAYWRLASEKHIRRAIHCVWKAHGKCSLTDVYRFVVSAADGPEKVADPEWRKESFCAQCVYLMGSRHPSDFDVGLTGDYWLVEWPALSDKTKSVIFSMTTNLLDKFLFGDIARMVSGETNFRPEEIGEGKVCLLAMPVLQWQAPARFFQIMFKTLVQRAALRRDVSQTAKPVVVWQDEAQLFQTQYDIQVQAVARQSILCNVVITQSLPVLFESLGGGPKAEQQAKALIGNLQTKFICQQSDRDTNEYFSGLLGHSRHLFGSSTSNGAQYDMLGDLMGFEQPGASYTLSEQWHPDVSPEQFTKLRKGGQDNGYLVECYVFQGGKRFSNGKGWIKATFKQRR